MSQVPDNQKECSDSSSPPVSSPQSSGSPPTDNKKRTAEQAFGTEDGAKPTKVPHLQRSPAVVSLDKANFITTGAMCANSTCPHGAAKICAKATTSSTSLKRAPVESKSSPAISSATQNQSVATTLTVSSAPAVAINRARPDVLSTPLATICPSKESVGSASTTTMTTTTTDGAETDPAEDLETQFAALGELLDNFAKICSYDQGYVKRQLIYACRTCTLDVLEPAGICLACALNCHEDHDVVPLLTRRNFRCDCGNSKFGPRKCKLLLEKESVNSENVYNGNFHGKICDCAKDLDSNTSEEVELTQCRLCEEQFHGNHIGVIPEDFGYEWDGELACPRCLNRHPFLKFYAAHLNNPESATTGISLRSEVLISNESSGCFFIDLQKKHGAQEKAVKGFVFPAKWWELLCKCPDCMNLYKNQKVEYLLDPDDTYAVYEERERTREQENARRASEMTPEEIFVHICEGFDPATQVELAHWFNNLRDIFVSFLRSKIELGQTITDADIEEFFEAFNNKQESENDE